MQTLVGPKPVILTRPTSYTLQANGLPFTRVLSKITSMLCLPTSVGVKSAVYFPSFLASVTGKILPLGDWMETWH